MMPRLKELYSKEIQIKLKEKLSLKNKYMAPQLKKVVLNMGLGVEGMIIKLLNHVKKIYLRSQDKNPQ